jgi:hypothetical protein
MIVEFDVLKHVSAGSFHTPRRFVPTCVERDPEKLLALVTEIGLLFHEYEQKSAKLGFACASPRWKERQTEQKIYCQNSQGSA